MHQFSEKTSSPGKKMIYINPNFKAHINPLFVNQPSVRMIHMNPNFLESQLKKMQTHNNGATSTQQMKISQAAAVVGPTEIAAVHINPTRKLVRNGASTTTTTNVTTDNEPINTNSKLNVVHAVNASSTTRKYKLDRRPVVSTIIPSPPQLKLVRSSSAPKKTISTGSLNSQSATSSIKKQKVNERRLRLVNINGVLFRSTYNKLQRKDTKTGILKRKQPAPKSIVARRRGVPGKSPVLNGSKFLMDAGGFRLKRMPSQIASDTSADSMCQRIDIGGVTFVATHRNDVFVRTRNHLTMAHLNSAKQRSLHQLTRHLMKSNIPCAIFQRLGKCKGDERGKCNKVHDKRHVTICPKFLQGECTNTQCILSHSVSLSKMPVCKFYLQGVCMRVDCPYLHKKLSCSTEICKDFLQGFCKLAEQCNKRHEFVCPEADTSGKCVTKNCFYCKSNSRKLHKKRQDHTIHSSPQPSITSITVADDVEKPKDKDEQNAAAPTVRYFIGKQGEKNNEDDIGELLCTENDNAELLCTENDKDENDVVTTTLSAAKPKSRPKIGILPAFIPLA